jgi:hypothetical protein
MKLMIKLEELIQDTAFIPIMIIFRNVVDQGM